MYDFHLDVSDDQRISAPFLDHWLEWTLVIELSASFVLGVAGFIAIAMGWV